MNNLVSAYCQGIGVPAFSLFDAAFNAGLRTTAVGSEALTCFRPEGIVYTGFRHFPRFDLDLSGATVLYLVRDPRDMLVSLYHSTVSSHAIPERHREMQRARTRAQQQTIDQFVLNNTKNLMDSFRQYQERLIDEATVIYRYEDVIYDKAAWLGDMLSRLELKLDRSLLNRVASRFDIFPKVEIASEHIRQVTPGDHQIKLKPDTIHALNSRLGDFMASYGYAS
ncbi:MAG: sulfotransferase domain-containing protein [Pseudomonadota bacterium]